MTEIPQPLPLEEQLRQDSRFNYLTRLSPSLVNSLVPLVEVSNEDKDQLHPKFWLVFCERYNMLAKGIREEVQEELQYNGQSLDDIVEHEWEVANWLDEEVIQTIEVTRIPGFFTKKSPGRLLSAVNQMNNEIIMEYEPLILGIPRRLREMINIDPEFRVTEPKE